MRVVARKGELIGPHWVLEISLVYYGFTNFQSGMPV